MSEDTKYIPEVKESAAEKSEKIVQAQLKDARAKRLALSLKKEPVVKIGDVKAEYRSFFLQNRKKYNIKSELENIIWLHFVSAGFNSPDKFLAGLAHFGIKIK